MNPVLALALALAVGIGVTRLPRPAVRHSLSLDLVLAAGAPLVLLGLLLGPGLGVLDRPTLRAIAPVTALGIGWIGAVLGARLEWRFLRRVPAPIWGLAAVQAAVVFGAVGAGAWLLVRLVPGLAAAWTPTLPAVLVLAAVATVSGPGAVALVARAAGVRPAIARTFERAAALDTAFGAAAFVVALALYHPRQPFAGVPIGWLGWTIALLAASGGVGMLFLWLSRLRPDPSELGLDVLGVILLGAGVGYATDLSPFVVCALATMLAVNMSPHRRQIQAVLAAWEHPIYAVFLIIAGALLNLPTLWILPAVAVLAAVRIAARWAPVRYGRGWLRVRDVPPHAGLASVAQGGVAVALGLTFNLIYAGSGTLLTTVLLGVALAQAAAGPLMGLALRPAPTEVS